MASRDSLKGKLAQCNDVEDYLAVAREAMAARPTPISPGNPGRKGECQFTGTRGGGHRLQGTARRRCQGGRAAAAGTDFAMTGEQMYVAEEQLKDQGRQGRCRQGL
jgi:hypothetical protein